MKCILHIGTEKTGTTLIQAWLRGNKARLGDQGIALSEVTGHPNRPLCAYFQSQTDDFFKRLQITTRDARDAFFDGFLDRFAAEIRDLSGSHHTMVISSEHFHSRLQEPDDIRRLHDFLSAQFDEIRVLCYFREQGAMIQSLYSTAVRNGADIALPAFWDDVAETWHYCNYMLMFSKWEAVFGRDALEPVLYDRDRFFDRDIRKDFIRRAAAAIRLDDLDYEVETANESLSAVQVALARAVNVMIPKYRDDGTIDPARRKLIASIARDGSLDFGPVRYPYRDRIYQMFDASNRDFARHFLGTEGNPFPPPPDETPETRAAAVIGPDELAEILYRVGKAMIGALGPGAARSIDRNDANRLRDIALRHEDGRALARADAVALLQIAQKGIPNGPKIRKKLREWGDAGD